MSQKKKIKINIDTEETAQNETTEKSTPEDDKPLKSESGIADNADPENVLKEMEARFEAKEEEAKETYDRLLRVSAEFENYKKRSAREMADFKKYANQSLLKELLPIIDNLDLAIKAAAEASNGTDACLLDGVELTRKEIPNFHEAVMREESDKHPENTVVNELQKGYLMHDRLLRPAMVVVAMPKSKDSS